MKPHTHHYEVHQSPYPVCFCFWIRDRKAGKPTKGFSPKPSAVIVVPVTGGGPLS